MMRGRIRGWIAEFVGAVCIVALPFLLLFIAHAFS